MGLLSFNNDPKKIIFKQAKREFPNTEIQMGSYCDLQLSLIHALKKSKTNFKERKLAIEQELQYLQLHDFGNFVGLRLGIYAYALAILAIVASNSYLQEVLGIPHIEYFVCGFIVFGCIITITLRQTEDSQKDRIIYLKFLMNCIDLLEQKTQKFQDQKNKQK